MVAIDPDLPIPLFYQLKTLILDEIVSGRYASGDRLPTEHELCAMYGISRTPAHRALSELADEGVIIRTRRRGTFVSPHWVPRRAATNELRVIVTTPELAAHVESSSPDELVVNVAVVGFSEMRHALTTAVAEGRAPDIALIDEVWIADFAEAGFILPLDELDADWVADEYEADFVKPFVEGRRYQSHVYAVPEEINVAGLWCSRDRLDGLGMAPPTTWSVLAQTASIIQEDLPRGSHAIAMPGGHVAGETTSYALSVVLASNGVSVVDDAVNLGAPPAVDGLRFLRSLVDAGSMGSEVVTYDWLRCPELLGSGKAAFTIGGSYEAEVVAEAAGLPLHDLWNHFVFVPFPAGPEGTSATVAGGMAYVVFRQSSHPVETMRLLEHVVATDHLVARARNHPTIPARIPAIEVIAAESSFVAEIAELFAAAVTRPSIPHYNLVSTQLQNMLEAVLTGRHGPAAAAERTAEVVAAITGRPFRHG